MSLLDSLVAKAILPLEQANSLPFSTYTDPSMLANEADAIFAKEWVFICMQGELPSPGDYYATILADEPICIVHGDDGQLRALSNICRHRGTTILDEGFGHVDKYLTCPYHAWAYSKEGALKAIPYNKVIAVDKADHQLTQYKAEVWNGLVFVNLDEQAAPLSQRLSNIDEYLQLFEPWTFNQVRQGEIEIWQSNWKLAMENAIL